MDETTPTQAKSFFVHKGNLSLWMDGLDAQTGFVENPDATPESVRKHIESLGIRAEDNIFSRGIIAAREEE